MTKKRWTKPELKKLRENTYKMTIFELGRWIPKAFPNRTPIAVISKVRRDFKYIKVNHKYSTADYEALLKMDPTNPTEVAAITKKISHINRKHKETVGLAVEASLHRRSKLLK